MQNCNYFKISALRKQLRIFTAVGQVEKSSLLQFCNNDTAKPMKKWLDLTEHSESKSLENTFAKIDINALKINTK